jgi:hypothetical protein
MNLSTLMVTQQYFHLGSGDMLAFIIDWNFQSFYRSDFLHHGNIN